MRSLIFTLATAALALGSAVPSLAEPAADTRQQAAKTYETKGDIARARQEYSAAVDWYLAALRNDKKNAALFNKLGIAELKLGETNQARRHFTDAVKIDKRYIEALNNLGATYCLQRKYKPAIRYLKDALALDEQRAVTHLNLAEAWMGAKQTDRAMTEYARALELDADILNSAASEGVFAQIATPEQRALVDFLIAKAYVKRGNNEGALEYLRRAKEQRYRNLASVYTDPDFAPLLRDPRLAAIVKR